MGSGESCGGNVCCCGFEDTCGKSFACPVAPGFHDQCEIPERIDLKEASVITFVNVEFQNLAATSGDAGMLVKSASSHLGVFRDILIFAVDDDGDRIACMLIKGSTTNEPSLQLGSHGKRRVDTKRSSFVCVDVRGLGDGVDVRCYALHYWCEHHGDRDGDWRVVHKIRAVRIHRKSNEPEQQLLSPGSMKFENKGTFSPSRVRSPEQKAGIISSQG